MTADAVLFSGVEALSRSGWLLVLALREIRGILLAFLRVRVYIIK